MKAIKDKHIVVIGAARSGVAAALLLQRNGADVFVSDFGSVPENSKNILKKAGVPFEENGHTSAAEQGDFAVVSPGVPTEAPIVQFYLKSGRKVYSEIEVASWFTDEAIIAITGSNGKTTVTSWLGHIWETAKQPYNLAGNIGFAFSDKADTARATHILEVSSFQLDHINSRFKPAVSVLLNITPDHMDRYQHKIGLYAASKFRITENQTEEDRFIFNFDDPLIKQHVEALKELFLHLGYRQIMNKFNNWIIFDDVQFIDKEWINRNKITHSSYSDKTIWFMVPLKSMLK